VNVTCGNVLLCCRNRDILIAVLAAGGLLLATVMIVITVCMCKQKQHAEKAKQELKQKITGCEETVVHSRFHCSFC